MVKFSKEFIVNHLKAYYEEYNDIPRSTNKNHPFSAGTVSNYFGSWNKALDTANIPRRRNVPQNVVCLQCEKPFQKRIGELKKTRNNFCSKKLCRNIQ
jgi:hypothetical protein